MHRSFSRPTAARQCPTLHSRRSLQRSSRQHKVRGCSIPRSGTTRERVGSAGTSMSTGRGASGSRGGSIPPGEGGCRRTSLCERPRRPSRREGGDGEPRRRVLTSLDPLCTVLGSGAARAGLVRRWCIGQSWTHYRDVDSYKPCCSDYQNRYKGPL